RIKTTMRMIIDISPLKIGAATPSSYLRKPWILFYFNTPTVVLHQMPMEHIHFVHGEVVDKFLYIINRIKIPTHIEHQAPPTESGSISNLHSRNANIRPNRPLGRQQLVNRLYRIKQAIRLRSDRFDPIGPNGQPIPFIAQRVGGKAQCDDLLTSGMRSQPDVRTFKKPLFS